MQIVICDDDKKIQEILRDKLERICQESGNTCQILCFSSGEEMLHAGQEPDILFLDIQMPGKDGMEIAEELRRRQWDTVLIFVTALSEYVYEAFDVDAFHYLVKPFQDEKLRKVVLKALERYKQQRKVRENREGQRRDTVRSGGIVESGMSGQYAGTGYFCGADWQNQERRSQNEGRKQQTVILIRQGGLSTAVPVENIIYAEVFNRKITLHTTNGAMEYYGKLTELSQQVGEDFYRTHRAYLVNLKYVEKYDSTTVWLEQGTALVSKKQFAGFVKQYMHYINRRGRSEWIR